MERRKKFVKSFSDLSADFWSGQTENAVKKFSSLCRALSWLVSLLLRDNYVDSWSNFYLVQFIPPNHGAGISEIMVLLRKRRWVLLYKNTYTWPWITKVWPLHVLEFRVKKRKMLRPLMRSLVDLPAERYYMYGLTTLYCM